MTFLLRTLVIVTAVLFFNGCSEHAKPASGKKVTIILDWFVNPDHAPIFVAKQQGYFKQQGLNVNIVAPADPNDGPKLVAAGKADIAITYQSGLLQDIDNQLPLMWVGTLFNTNLNAMAVLKDGPIKTISDLKGKTIGSSAVNIDQAAVGAMLRHAGLSLSDVKLVNVRYNLVQALLSHKVDAISGIMRNFEPIEMQLAGHPARVFKPEEHGVPDSACEIFIVHRDQANKPWVKKFLLAIKQGTAYLKAHPQKTWQVFAKNHPELNNALNQQAWTATYPYFADDPTAYDPTSLTAFATFMKDSFLIKDVPPLERYVAMPKH